MRFFNFNLSHLEAFLSVANNCGIKLPIDHQEVYQINDWSNFIVKIISVQQIYLNEKSKEEIEAFPPFETHPYIGNINIPNNTHKTLVLGTFPPPSYLHELYPELSNSDLLKGIDIDATPPLYYFYGNRGSLWDILDIELNQNAITKYLENSNIFMSDIILLAQRKSFTENRAADSNYINIIPNIPLLTFLIEEENTIENIVFTSKKWKVTDDAGRGRRKSNYVPESIQFTEENSAISLFFRTLTELNYSLGFQKLGTEEIVSFTPLNYKRINEEFTDLFAFNLLINDRLFIINIGDSPSGNAFTPFDSSSFIKWVKKKWDDKGIQVLRDNPRNSKSDLVKRERKIPIQRDLKYPAEGDICNDFQNEIYTMFFQRNFDLIQDIQNQNINYHD
jgi:hypothetical protein